MAIELKVMQIKAAQLLAIGTSITEVAEQINTTRQTIHHWLKEDDAFLAYLNRLKTENLEATRTMIQSASSIAVNTLVNVMQNSKSDVARIAAAKEVLSMSGFTKESYVMYAWGVGGDTVGKVQAEKQSAKEMEMLSANY